MNAQRRMSVGLVTLLLGGLSGCKHEEAPKPTAEAQSTAASTAASPNMRKGNGRMPMGPMARLEPQAMKEYRLDICYYGTLTLRQARDGYLASLGKDEPSEKKIPNFGVPAAAASASPAVGGAKAAPPPPPRPSAAAGSASAAPVTPPGAAQVAPTRPYDFAFRAPHERNARACTAAMALKDFAMPGVDEALAQFAPFAVDLAKDIAATSSYYQREEYKKDSFAKGKELDKKLRDGFGKLDDLQDKLGAALASYRKEHPVDASKLEEGEKVTRDTFEDARAVMTLLLDKKMDVVAYKAAAAQVDKSVESLKTWSAAHAGDNWTKIMSSAFDAFAKTARETKVGDKGISQDAFLDFVTNFTGIVEARQRALQRAAIAKGQTSPVAVPDMPAHPQIPPPAQPPQ